jgi:hypothetical protein
MLALACVEPLSVGTGEAETRAGAGGDASSSTGGGTPCAPGLDCDAGEAGDSGTISSSGGTGQAAGGSGSGAASANGGAGSTVGDAGDGSAVGDGGVGSTAGDGTGAVSGSGTGGSTGGNVLGSIEVSADALARDHSIVSFPLPSARGKNVVLTDSEGNEIPLQVSPVDGKASFVLASLAAGERATYTIVELASAPPAGVTTSVEGDQLFLKQADKTIFRWVLAPDNFRDRPSNNVRAGYIYPLYTPAGVSVLDDYPEAHPHTHGIWSAWAITTFRGSKVDFWNSYDNSGHVDLEAMEGVWQGPVHAGLVAHLRHEAILYTPPVKVLHEKWVVTAYKTHAAEAPYYVFDIDSEQETATSDPLILEQYHYGGFGFSGSEEWQGSENANFLTSEGLTRANGDGLTARWCAEYGAVGGKVAGFAALGHPTNLRAPQGLRIHPVDPHWSFTAVTASSGGRFTLEPGAPYVSRFRVVAFDGPADAALLDRLWNDFATPPTVIILP